MYYFVSIITGALIASTIAMNGEMADIYGLYSATALIHLFGLILIGAIMALKKQNPIPEKKLPVYIYMGGVVGVLTVVFSNFAFGKISVSAILALGLLGQCIASLIVDQFGMFGMPKHRFTINKLIGIAFVIAGIVIIILPFSKSTMAAIALALMTGFTIVLSRTLNARLASEMSITKSTFYNYFTGFVVSVVLLLVLGTNEPMFAGAAITPKVWIYLGGFVGVAIIMVLNALVSKITSFYMTLLLFVGQVLCGVAIDAIISRSFSINILAGGILVAVGLSLNVWFDRAMLKKA